MNKLKTVDSKVLSILKECPETRFDDMKLTIKEDFLSECSLMELEPAKAKALYLCKHPLDRLYNDWLKSDVNYMDMVRDSIDSSVNRAVKEMKARQKESR